MLRRLQTEGQQASDKMQKWRGARKRRGTSLRVKRAAANRKRWIAGCETGL